MLALFVRWLAPLVILMTSGVLLARWSGESLPTSDQRVVALSRCHDQPCVLGLIPGETSWEVAQDSLAADGARKIYRKTEPAGEFGFFPSVDRLSLGRVSIILTEPMQAGWIIQRFGAPCGVSLYWEMQIVTLRYPAFLANVQMTGDGLHLNDSVTSIHFNDPHFHMDRESDRCMDTHSPHAVHNTVWMGFAPFRRYLNLRLEFTGF